MEPGQIDGLIESYFSRFLDFIYENQGDITETAGDGLMIIFQGEDPDKHALNAVKTAISIQQTTETLATEATEKPNSQNPIRINIGINSGPALVGFTRFQSISGDRVTFTATGLTTILAARLEAMATEGSILLSSETLNRAMKEENFSAFDWQTEDLGAVELKNLPKPEQIYRISPPRNSQADQPR